MISDPLSTVGATPLPPAVAAAAAALEPARQQALNRYEILDTAPEIPFDDLTRLAALICQTPMALVSLIDEDRQWFKSRVGMPATQTPRHMAFCDHVVRNQEMLEVPDAQLDARFAHNPLVTAEPNLRFYAGMPLRTPDGFYLGSICVLDTVPRHLTDAQRGALQTIAEQVMAQLALRLRANQTGAELQDAPGPKPSLSQLTSVVAYGLKSPLIALQNMAEQLLTAARGGDAGTAHETLTVMGTEADRVQKLISQMTHLLRPLPAPATAEAGT